MVDRRAQSTLWGNDGIALGTEFRCATLRSCCIDGDCHELETILACVGQRGGALERVVRAAHYSDGTALRLRWTEPVGEGENRHGRQAHVVE